MLLSKVGAAYDMGDALAGVIYDYRQLIGIKAIATANNEVAADCSQIESLRSLNRVGKAHGGWRNAEPDGERSIRLTHPLAAPSGIVQLIAV